MEGVPRLYMLSCDLKKSPTNTDFSGPLKKYIHDFYHENPGSYDKEIKEMEALRQTVIKVPHDSSGCAILKRYFSQLILLQNRFPMTDDGPVCVPFTWVDVYSGDVATITDIKYEQACVLYNIGALHSQLGALDARNDAEGMKMACTHFQCAAWAFEHLREAYSQPIGSDISHDVLTCKMNIMLAQAQECILEKSILDDRKSSIIAKVAAQVVDYYRCAFGILNGTAVCDIIGGKIYKTWKKYVEFKMAYYTSIAHFFMGNNAEEQQKMGDRVAWFQTATEFLNEAIHISKGMDKENLDESLTFLVDVIGGKFNSSKKENDFVYHEKVPHASALPVLKGASLVRGIPFNPADPDVCGVDMFTRLVPMKAMYSSSMYSEEKAKLLRSVLVKVEEKDEELSTYLSSLQLDRNAFTDEDEEIPEQLIEKCAALSVRPTAVSDLTKLMTDLKEISSNVEVNFKLCYDLLANEEMKDTKYQREVSVKRIPSMIIMELKKECSKLEQAHKKAIESNQTIQNAASTHLDNLRILSSSIEELKEKLPRSRQKIKSDVMQDFQRLVDKVDEMQEQRMFLSQQLRDALHSDDITSRLVSLENVAEVEGVFQQELKKHDQVLDYIEKNLSAQDNILSALTQANAACADVRQSILTVKNNRTIMINTLIASYEAYEDVMEKGQKGLSFYQKLKASLSKLFDRIKSVTNVQEEERSQRVYALSEAERHSSPETRSSSEVGSETKLKHYMPHLVRSKVPSSAFPQPPKNMPVSTTASNPLQYPMPSTYPSSHVSQFIPPENQAPSPESNGNPAFRSPAHDPANFPSAHTSDPYHSVPFHNLSAHANPVLRTPGQHYDISQMPFYTTHCSTRQPLHPQFYAPFKTAEREIKPGVFYSHSALPDDPVEYRVPVLQGNDVNFPSAYNINPPSTNSNMPSNGYSGFGNKDLRYPFVSRINSPNTYTHSVTSVPHYVSSSETHHNMSYSNSGPYSTVVSGQYSHDSKTHIPANVSSSQNQYPTYSTIAQSNNSSYNPPQFPPTSSYPSISSTSQIYTDTTNSYPPHVYENTQTPHTHYHKPENISESNTSVYASTNSTSIPHCNSQVYPEAPVQAYPPKMTETHQFDDYKYPASVLEPTSIISQEPLQPVSQSSVVDVKKKMSPEKVSAECDSPENSEKNVLKTSNPDQICSSQTADTLQATIRNQITCDLKLSDDNNATQEKSRCPPKPGSDRSNTGDPLSNHATLMKFVAEVEKYEKLVEGLVRKSLNGTTPLDQKWKELMDTQEKESRKLSISVARCYRLKNRVPDIMPYDSNRVKIVSSKDDYINASYLTDLLPPSSPVFVITQAPLPLTYCDFWLMVWEQQVENVVCLLPLNELKGHIYWPAERELPVTHGTFKLTLQSQKEQNGCIIRIINIYHIKNKASRVVVHLHFKSWCSSKMPLDSDLLCFVSTALNYYKQQRSLSRPLVVHCSAGVGRTGIFCLLAALLSEIDNAHGPRDVSSVAARICTQRKFIIQDKEQLKFCYDAVLSYAQSCLEKRGIIVRKQSFDDKSAQISSELENDVAKLHLSLANIEAFTESKISIKPMTDPTVCNTESPVVSPDLITEKDIADSEKQNLDSHVSGSQNDNSSMDLIQSLNVSTHRQPMEFGARSNTADISTVSNILDPNNFTLDSENTPSKPRRITKDTFIQSTGVLSLSNADSSDPLSNLDPLWSLKKM